MTGSGSVIKCLFFSHIFCQAFILPLHQLSNVGLRMGMTRSRKERHVDLKQS